MNARVILLVVVALAGITSSANAQLFRTQRVQYRVPVYQTQVYRFRMPQQQRYCPQQYMRPQCQNQYYLRPVVQYRTQQPNFANPMAGQMSVPSLANQRVAPPTASNNSTAAVPEIEPVIDGSVQPAAAEMEDLPMIEELIVDPEVLPAGDIPIDPIINGNSSTLENSVLEKGK